MLLFIQKKSRKTHPISIQQGVSRCPGPFAAGRLLIRISDHFGSGGGRRIAVDDRSIADYPCTAAWLSLMMVSWAATSVTLSTAIFSGVSHFLCAIACCKINISVKDAFHAWHYLTNLSLIPLSFVVSFAAAQRLISSAMVYWISRTGAWSLHRSLPFPWFCSCQVRLETAYHSHCLQVSFVAAMMQ